MIASQGESVSALSGFRPRTAPDVACRQTPARRVARGRGCREGQREETGNTLAWEQPPPEDFALPSSFVVPRPAVAVKRSSAGCQVPFSIQQSEPLDPMS